MYYESELLNQLRNKPKICKGCEECDYAETCNGGLKCLYYALTGELYNAIRLLDCQKGLNNFLTARVGYNYLIYRACIVGNCSAN